MIFDTRLILELGKLRDEPVWYFGDPKYENPNQNIAEEVIQCTGISIGFQQEDVRFDTRADLIFVLTKYLFRIWKSLKANGTKQIACLAAARWADLTEWNGADAGRE